MKYPSSSLGPSLDLNSSLGFFFKCKHYWTILTSENSSRVQEKPELKFKSKMEPKFEFKFFGLFVFLFYASAIELFSTSKVV